MRKITGLTVGEDRGLDGHGSSGRGEGREVAVLIQKRRKWNR